jgi:tetratricopeptide (TPR) repeat protein
LDNVQNFLSSPKSYYNQVFLDLSSFRGGLPQHYKINYAFDQLCVDASVSCHVQFNLPESFRKSLVTELRAQRYDVDRPLDLPSELRTPEWQTLCDHVSAYGELSVRAQIRVVRLLGALCFHREILRQVPPLQQMNLSESSEVATLAFLRAFSNLLVRSDMSLPTKVDELEFIAEASPPFCLAKVSAALQLLVVHALFFRDVDGAQFWCEFARSQLQSLLPTLDSFTASLLHSNFLRAASFVPQLANDASRLVDEMNQCQSHAESLHGDTAYQEYLCHENLSVIIESRAKEALWLNDLDLADARTRQLISRCSFEPRYHLELGEILLQQRRLEESARIYRRAATLGPPDTSIALFMAGQCHQSLGEYELASDAYYSSIDADPLALSPVRKLGHIASITNDDFLAAWSEMRLAELEKKKSELESQGGVVERSRLMRVAGPPP